MMVDIRLEADFALVEFVEVSRVAVLSPQQIEHARWHSDYLQRVRDAINLTFAAPTVGGEWQVHVTSFIRDTGGGDHATGAAVDWNVRDKNGNRNFVITRWARDWLAVNFPNAFAELLWEDDHVHQARRGYSRDISANTTPQILDKTPTGWVVAAINTIPKPAQPIALAFAIGFGVWLASKTL